MTDSVDPSSSGDVQYLDALRLPVAVSRGELSVGADTVVANLGLSQVELVDADGSGLPARASTILTDVRLRGGPLLAAEPFLAPQADPMDLPRHLLGAGWVESLTSAAEQGAPHPGDGAPSLLRSPTADLGSLFARPCDFAETGALSTVLMRFRLRLTVWFASAGTDCGVHRDHDFLEHHVQLHGRGRMQKFHERRLDSRYEEQLLSRGTGQPGLHCSWRVEDDHDDPARVPSPVYPWHQYYADTDCAFAVIEYHVESLTTGPKAYYPLVTP